MVTRLLGRAGYRWAREVFLLALLVLGAELSAWAEPKGPPDPTGPSMVTDFRGVRLTRVRPVMRVVSLIESATTAFYMLGAEQVLVGVSQQVYDPATFGWYQRLDPRIKQGKLPVPGNWDFVNLESVLALRPDLVVMWASQQESIAALEERGVPVFAVFVSDEQDLYHEVEAFGALTGRQERARVLIEYTRRQLGEVARRLAGLSDQHRPRVYYMWAGSDLETSCGKSTVNDLLTRAGAINVCRSIPMEHATVNAEQLLVWNPDAIVMWHNRRRSPEQVRSDPRWQTLRAVKTGAVLQLPDPFLVDLWTLKFQGAVRLLAHWLHPDLFPDLAPDRELSQMLEVLYGSRWRQGS